MDKKTKTVFTIIIGILVLITVVGFVYGMQNKKQTDAIYASYDNNILQQLILLLKYVKVYLSLLVQLMKKMIILMIT